MTKLTYTDEINVQLVQHCGGDHSVVASARVSVEGPSVDRWRKEDPEKSAGLIRSLLRNKHGTPFEHNSMTFLVEAPIFVFREWHRHRIGWSYNEWSARYQKKMEPRFWLPSTDRPLVKSGSPMAPDFSEPGGQRHEDACSSMKASYESSWREYERVLELGVANEVARSMLPVGLFSSMYATCNTRSLMAFLSLRTNRPDAAVRSYPQREIETCAKAMEDEFAKLFPITYDAYNQNGRVAP